VVGVSGWGAEEGVMDDVARVGRMGVGLRTLSLSAVDLVFSYGTGRVQFVLF
jgi:hypothetical protein